MKTLIKKIFSSLGIEIKKTVNSSAGKDNRPVGQFKPFLEDLKHRGFKCDTIFDIGANKAEWSRMYKEVYPQTNSILIEPLLECEDELKKFVSDYPQSKYFLLATGSQNTNQTITIWDDLYGSSLLPSKDETKTKSGKQRTIEVIKLDDLVAKNNLPVPQLIKIDVQGYELETLKGATLLMSTVEIIILEVSLYSFEDVPGMPEFYEVVNFMYNHNYVVYDFPGFLRRPFDGALGQCDICFVKKDSFLRKEKKW